MNFKEISPYELEGSNAFRAVGKDWMLICAEAGGVTNAMTASWGFLGNLWNRPAAVCFIRPQRYTYGLTEQAERFSLCFFGGAYRRELGVFGTVSGRDCDKAAATGMHYVTVGDVPALAEATVVLACRKLYLDDIREANFLDASLVDEEYPARDFHRVYVCEVEHCYVAE